jgi:uncharacterized protein involved in cysteine biosynthesis
MSGMVFALAVSVWLVALLGFGLVAIAWFGVARLAPGGQKLATVLELGFLNFPAVERRLGGSALPLIRTYRRGTILFAAAVGVFLLLTLINIIGGNAA